MLHRPPRASNTVPTLVTTRSISIANRHPQLRIDRRALLRAIAVLDERADLFAARAGCAPGAPAGELSLVFLTDEALAQLHDEFLDDPSVTDVITFEGEPALGSAGEICVSVDAALRQVQPTGGAGKTPRPRQRATPAQAARSAEAFSNELLLYVVHGWLHLAGYDDLQPAKKRIMRRAEARALRLVRLQVAHGGVFRLAPVARGKKAAPG